MHNRTAETQDESLLQRLGPDSGVSRTLHVRSVDSTNLLARTMTRDNGPAELLVLADGQTAGRGRLGRSFLSPPGEGLWFTRVMRPAAGHFIPPSMTLVAGTAVCLALRRLGAADAAVKWPNDILIGGLKVAGILAEASQDSAGNPFLILGIGINLENRAFPPELTGIATSVFLATGLHIDRFILLRTILEELERLRRLLADEGFQAVRPFYLDCSAVMGREVLLLDPAAAGAPGNGLSSGPHADNAGTAGSGATIARAELATCIDIDDDGALVLLGRDGRRFRRNAGEISLRLTGAEGRMP